MGTGCADNYRSTSVRHAQLRIEVHDGSGRMAADVYRFVIGDISAGGRTYFVSPVPVVGAGYRVTVQSFGGDISLLRAATVAVSRRWKQPCLVSRTVVARGPVSRFPEEAPPHLGQVHPSTHGPQAPCDPQSE